MATVNGLISIQIDDAYGIESSTDFFITIDDTKTVANVETDVAGLVNVVESLTQGRVTSSDVRIFLPGGAGVTPLGDIEKGALFNFGNATDHYKQGFWIGDVAPSILNSNGLIDLTNTDVQNFITFMTTVHTAITIVTKGVRALTALRDALISFRKHRKPLERKTTEQA